jgi:mannose-6-phosphate isomerase-like protein (cupin superfamily)
VENFEEILKKEGFKHIYRWSDNSRITYPKHAHKDKVAMFITSGSIEIVFEDKTIKLKIGDRFDVPSESEHTALVGPDGCSYVVGEMIEGDS